MAQPWSALYGGGTQFARSINNIASPWRGGLTHNSSPFPGGVDNPLQNVIPGLGGSSSYDAARRPNLGAYDQTNFQLLLDFERYQPHHATANQLCFVSIGQMSNNITHAPRSVASMNQMLSSEEGIKRYGSHFSSSRIFEDWTFYGVPVSNTPEHLMHVKEKVMGFHIGRRARILSPAAGIATSGSSPAARIGDHVYLIVRRVMLKDELEERFRDLHSGAMPSNNGVRSLAEKRQQERVPSDPPEEPRYCWRIDPYISQDRCPPPSYLYNTETGIGRSLFIGSVYSIYGSTYYSPSAVRQVQAAMHPTKDSTDYLEVVKSGRDIEVQIGVF